MFAVVIAVCVALAAVPPVRVARLAHLRGARLTGAEIRLRFPADM